jgi:hypothetical protein
MLWKALEMKSISETLINIIKEIYNGNRCQIKIRTSPSQAFYTSKGFLQGCCMSPTLFKVFVEASLNEWSSKYSSMGIQIKNNLYLQVILAQDAEDADYICQKLIEEYHNWGLKINVSETVYLAPNIDDDDDLY